MIAFLAISTAASADIRVLADQEQECITGGLCVGGYHCCSDICDGWCSFFWIRETYECLMGTGCEMDEGVCCLIYRWSEYPCLGTNYLAGYCIGALECSDMLK
jgi:hypothetical protein